MFDDSLTNFSIIYEFIKSLNRNISTLKSSFLARIIPRLVTFIKKVYFISHTATAYQMDKNVLFFIKEGPKKETRGPWGRGKSIKRPDPPQTKVENLELEKL